MGMDISARAQKGENKDVETRSAVVVEIMDDVVDLSVAEIIALLDAETTAAASRTVRKQDVAKMAVATVAAATAAAMVPQA